MIEQDLEQRPNGVRCLGQILARELSPKEVDSVSGGASYTGISNFQIDEEGNADFNFSDYEW